MDGLLGVAGKAQLPTEELRFGVVLNGGVSLAVWMGGTVHELDRLTKAIERGGARDPYAAMLTMVGSTARADVLAGTSAGGINGAALALAQVNRGADLGTLRDLWIEQGRIESLLQQPFKGDPTSLLRGDEYFLPALHDAMTRLAGAPGNRGPDVSPVDLTITATVLRGNQTVTLDSMGQQLPQTVHAGLFNWSRVGRRGAKCDPFAPRNIQFTARQLALASRSTASFPVAFEPSYIPVNSPDFPRPGNGAASVAATESQRVRPDMSDVVTSWGTGPEKTNRSRFVIDGGVLANTPTMAALRAVEAMKADGPVRRVMLLVYPHAPSPEEDVPDVLGKAPSVAGALNGLLGALTAQGGRTFVDQLEEHNRRAAGRRGTRSDILASSTPDELHALADRIYPHYTRLRLSRAARDLAARLAGKYDDGTSAALPAGWNYERIRAEAQRGQEAWLQTHRSLPYVPEELPTGPGAAGWEWGVSGALGVVEAATELLRQVVAAHGELNQAYEDAAAARRAVFELRASIQSMRDAVDAAWATDRGDAWDPVIASLAPNQRYWLLRLAYYDYLMNGATSWDQVVARIDQVAQFEGRLAAQTASADAAAAIREARDKGVRDALMRRLHDNAVRSAGPTMVAGAKPDPVADPGTAGAAGRQIGLLVDAAVEKVRSVVVALPPASLDHASRPYEQLLHWQKAFDITTRMTSEDLLTRLLHLEVAATLLGDEVTTGATLPVELVQLSAQTRNGFAQYSRTADDKLGGWSLNRFGGFLKRSWRANDWTWGRVDAATMLCRTVLHPGRLRRVARLTGYLDQGTPQERADATVTELVGTLFGEPRAELQALATEARRELEQVLDATVEEGDLPATLPALADLFARAVHEQVVVTELPAIATAIRADAVEGGYQRSRGEVFLATEGDLLARLSSESEEAPLSPTDRTRALRAFDAAGIGREALREESSSDMTIRTATTAAAVATTVLSSGRSGLQAVSPVTKALRGLMMLPYWVVTGLTSKGGLARGLSLLGLALGGTLLALSLFGALPEQISGPATALGASAVLVALAYAALRTGTLLHGVVLLSPVVPLLTYSVIRGRDEEGAAQGSTTLAVVIGLTVVLMLLGSFGASHGSVASTLDRLAIRRGVPVLTRPRGGGAGKPRPTWVRWLEAVARSVWPLLIGAVALAGVAVAVALAVRTDLVQLHQDWSWPAWLKWTLVGGLMIVATGLGAWVAKKTGTSLRVLARVPAVDAAGNALVDDAGNVQLVWQHQRVANPRGVAVSWAVLYGIAYELIVILLLADPLDLHGEWWYRAALVTALLFAAALVLVVPWLLPVLEYAAIRRAEQLRAGAVSLPEDYAVDLAVRGLGYQHYVRAGSEPQLTWYGERLRTAVQKACTAVT